MTIRTRLLLYAFFLVPLSVTTAAFAQQQPPSPPAAPHPPDHSMAYAVVINGGNYLGVTTEEVTRENMGRYGMREPRGVAITSVVKDGPAERAGLRKDDVILRFDNEPITSARKLTRLISEAAPEQTVRLTISRGGSEQEVSVTLGSRRGPFTISSGEEMRARVDELRRQAEELGQRGATIFSFGSNRRIGVTTTALTKQLGEYFGVSDGRGVLVTSVAENSQAARAGLRAGDVITAVDGTVIEDTADLARAIGRRNEGDVTLTIIREKSQRTITVTPERRDSFVPQSAPRISVSPVVRISPLQIQFGLNLEPLTINIPWIQ